MSTAPNKSPCCKCLRWFPRDDLTAKNSFCVRCAKNPSLRGAKCRWCRGNLPLPENGKDPTSATCDNCTKLQLKYGPPVHCTLCKLEASFKTKRGSKVCRRCDYCIQNYGKAKACEKCKVKAAWEGGKIEKINGLTLCFICTFREKRKTKLGEGKEGAENKNPKLKNGESKSKKTQKSSDTSKEKPASKKKPPKAYAEDPTEVKDKNAPTSLSIIDNLKISEIEVIETMQVDEHTSASLQVNDLLLKVKEMNAELARRKKIIEEKDVCISSLKGTLTSATTDHERQRKSWESRLGERISEFKAKILKLESENAKLRKEKSERKKKNKTKKMAKQTTMIRKDPNAVKLELFSNSLKMPDRPSSRSSIPEQTKRKKDSDSEDKKPKSPSKLAESSDDSDSDSKNPPLKRIKTIDSDDDEDVPVSKQSPKLKSDNEDEEKSKRKISSDSDDDDVEATLKAIDEEEKKSLEEAKKIEAAEQATSSTDDNSKSPSENLPKEINNEESSPAADKDEAPTGPQTPPDNPPEDNEENEVKDETVPMLSDSSEDEDDDLIDTRFRY